MTIDPKLFYIALSIAFLLVAALGYFIWKQRKQMKDTGNSAGAPRTDGMTALSGPSAAGTPDSIASRQMQLQA
jgi:hypothetical protein